MALINHGLLDALVDVSNLRSADEGATRGFEQTFSLTTSSRKRGLALKSLRLGDGFGSLLARIFDPSHHVFFVAWGWDLSGAPPFEYPGLGVAQDTVIIPLKAGTMREFLGAGALLFPARQLTGGLAVRIMVWESDKAARDFGAKMTKVSEALRKSALTNVLSGISLATGVTGATVTLAANAAIELAGIVGNVLKEDGDNYVDFYEGYYPAEHPWTAGDEVHTGSASEIRLTRIEGI